MTQPIDHEVRVAAITDLERPYALTAGAGTGKTRTLVERVVGLLGAGVHPERIAVVTFTEAATQELRSRVRRALDGRLEAAPPEMQGRWRTVLSNLERLTVATLHAFALSLLRAEALDADFAPDVEVADESVAAAILDEALKVLWRGWSVERAVEVATKVSPSQLRAAGRVVLARRDLSPLRSTEALDWAQVGDEGGRLAEALVEAAGACQKPATCKLYGRIAELLDALGHRPADSQGCGRFLAGIEVPEPVKSGGQKADWPGDSRDVLRNAWSALHTWHQGLIRLQWAPVHRDVVEGLFQRVVTQVAEAKAQAGHAGYDDLLFSTARLLATRPAARHRLAARFEHLLVDEVQDTDPLQAEIVARLLQPESEVARWTELPSPARGLFAVGDPKQSIYRFRRADVHVWRDLSAWVGRTGVQAALRQGFRSVPDIVAFVNHVFRELPDYEPLVAHRGPARLEPVVVLDTEDELGALVLHLKGLLQSGAEVVDADTGQLRVLQHGDIMVLLPAWTHAHAVQDALVGAGIPSVIEGGRRFFTRDEVRLAIAGLRAVDEPDDREATVFALRGLFGHSHEDLARHVEAGGRWSCTIPPPAESPCQASLRLLGQLHSRRDGRSWAGILGALLEATQADAVWAMRGNGEAALANLEKLRALILQLEAQSATPSETIERLVELARTSDSEEDLDVRDPEASAVRITTYFKAKGREAPVVYLVQAHRRAEAVTAVVDRPRGELALKVGDLHPPDWDAHEAREKEELREERQRWMYVAMTRARDQLVLVRGPQAGKSADLYPPSLTGAVGVRQDDRDERLQVAGASVRVRGVAVADGDQAKAPIETFLGVDAQVDAALTAAPLTSPADAWSVQRTEAIRDARRAGHRWVTVSQLVQPRRTERTGIGVRAGQAVHRVMEALDLREPTEALEAQLEGWLEVIAPQLGLRQDEREAAHAVLRRLIRHEVIERARVAPERWTETPFAFPDRGRVVTGVIDLCFPVDEARTKWVVVDYKSDAPRQGSPVLAAYQAQLRFYAQAILRNILDHEVEVVDQVLCGPPEELAEAPREAALDEVVSALAPGLEALLDAGAPTPAVAPLLPLTTEGVVELWFEEAKVALLIDQPDALAAELEGAGVTVIRVSEGGPDWAEQATRDLAHALGVELAEERTGEASVVEEPES
ncbi:MAG: UvrD-helicase domain-containing protein [Alphaproteobacteria bacterium]|nr:UvrD-helicase domain-containing protein [Alphaproteobacteria bacterium]